MLRSCSKCGRIHDSNFKCNAGRLPKTNEQALRKKNKWTEKSKDIRARSFYLCAICKAQGDYRAKPVEVHHIRKLKDYPDGLLEDDNLICLCIEHHKAADKGDILPEELYKLVQERDQ